MLVSYPALFYYDLNETVKYFVYFPDLDANGTQGETISDAIYSASDLLGINIADDIEQGREIPKPSDINSLSLINNNPFKDDEDFDSTFDISKSFISIVSVDVSDYLGSQEPVKKTLTIPTWADRLGREMNLNFSKTLTDAIADKKIGA